MLEGTPWDVQDVLVRFTVVLHSGIYVGFTDRDDGFRHDAGVMKRIILFSVVGLACAPADEGNPSIDIIGFQAITAEVKALREERRVEEAEFIRMSQEEGTVILDTRSRGKFEKLHVKGAIHLNFSDFTEASLREVIPEKTTRVLIYCNNNFDKEPVAFPGKFAPVALNIPTFINLHAYGYTEVYELKPFLDIGSTKIPFEGTSALKKEAK